VARGTSATGTDIGIVRVHVIRGVRGLEIEREGKRVGTALPIVHITDLGKKWHPSIDIVSSELARFVVQPLSFRGTFEGNFDFQSVLKRSTAIGNSKIV
jgi:hypothetical protein